MTQPEPQVDPAPEAHPGGADAVADDPDDFPLQTPDQPRAAHVEEMPEEIGEPEGTDRDRDEGTSGSSESDDDAASKPEKDEPA
ncbi:MAG: hypothetical protein M3130_06745 [Actinomycetota bacterium]|nr:hypothetical protein [Actinomycetota bacterium]